MKRSNFFSVLLILTFLLALVGSAWSQVSVGFLRGDTTRAVLGVPLCRVKEAPRATGLLFVGTDVSGATFDSAFRKRDLYVGLGLGWDANPSDPLVFRAQLGYTANGSRFIRDGRFTQGEWGYGVSLRYRF